MADVFISYSTKDEAFVRLLHDRLIQDKRDVWVDWKGINPTDNWLKAIFSSIEAADNFLFVVSPDSCASEMCREEVAYADANHKRLILVVCRPVKNRELPPALSRLQWIEFIDGSFEQAFDILREAIDTNPGWVHSHSRLQVRAREWDANGRNNAFLLRGIELQNASQWHVQAPTRERKATLLQEEYIHASQEWEAGEIQRLKKLNEESERQARVATVRELVSCGLSLIAEEPELSLLLSMHALAITQTRGLPALPEALSALHRALLASRVRLGINVDSYRGVKCLAWSPDGNHLVTNFGKGAKLWETETGREVMTLGDHGEDVESLAWKPDGNHLATGHSNGAVKVWELKTGREVRNLRCHSRTVRCITWRPDGQRLATGGIGDNTARAWDAVTGKELYVLPGGEKSVQWSPNGERLATDFGRAAKIWEAETGRELFTLEGHDRDVLSVAWSPDGKRLATGSADATAKLWNVETREALFTLKGHQHPIHSVTWSFDGRQVATGSSDGTAKVWDIETGQELFTLKGHKLSVAVVAWSPHRERLATGSWDGTVRLWETGIARELLAFNARQDGIWTVAWSPDGSRIATGTKGEERRVVTIWNSESGRELAGIENTGTERSLWRVSWSRDGKWIATSSFEEGAEIWDAATGHKLVTLDQSENPAWDTAWNEDGARLLAGSRVDDAAVWDTKTGRKMFTLKGSACLGFRSVAWSKDGKQLATTSEEAIQIWDAANGNPLLAIKVEGTVWSLAWSPDGNKLAAANGANTRIWEIGTGREWVLPTDDGVARSVSWRSDGKWLATASATDTKVWDAETGLELFALKGHEADVHSVSWSPDGGRLTSSGDDSIVQIYAIDFDLLTSLARSRVTRNLTGKECTKYLHLDEVPPIPFSSVGDTL